MNPQSCSLDHVFNASETPLDRQLSLADWLAIERSAPMLVRTVNGRDRDVRLHKDTLLKFVLTAC